MTKYFGVIGNRDYIKYRGVKRPFWEFLDRQPDGWLTSLVYKRKDLPDFQQMIYDCGAWSYRDEPEFPFTIEEILEQYSTAPAGSMLIAPDMMDTDECDWKNRQSKNRTMAEQFIKSCPSHYIPMATVHGQSIGERVDVARDYMTMGYKHISLGGMAKNAAKKTEMIETVRILRKATEGAYLHILGLSSPEYWRAWNQLGVDSCDGSSHFKQAFTGGAFFSLEGSRLVKHQAARPGNGDCHGIVAPECSCTVCSMLRKDGIDTRTYGSNEHNMGRAAHNLNMLMRTHSRVLKRKIGLVACCGEKDTIWRPAGEMYKSDLFLKSKAWAEGNCDDWFILSARYGLVHHAEEIGPYDETLNKKSKRQKDEWNQKVAVKLQKIGNATLYVLAGENYRGWTKNFPGDIEVPMQGLGIGQQLAWLKKRTPTQPTLF